MTNGILSDLPEGVVLNVDDFDAGTHFRDTVCAKRHVVLHLTEGASARSSFDWLMHMYSTIMVPFFVDRDGTIYQTFPCDRWAYHLGAKVPHDYDMGSVGIEIANYGPLRRQDTGLYTLYDMKKPLCDLADEDRYTCVDRYYRDYGYFESLPEVQVKAIRVLVHALCAEFDIPPRFIDNPWEIEPSRNYRPWRGVMHHGKWRRDKLDIHPAFPLDGLQLEGDWSWPSAQA